MIKHRLSAITRYGVVAGAFLSSFILGCGSPTARDASSAPVIAGELQGCTFHGFLRPACLRPTNDSIDGELVWYRDGESRNRADLTYRIGDQDDPAHVALIRHNAHVFCSSRKDPPASAGSGKCVDVGASAQIFYPMPDVIEALHADVVEQTTEIGGETAVCYGPVLSSAECFSPSGVPLRPSSYVAGLLALHLAAPWIRKAVVTNDEIKAWRKSLEVRSISPHGR